MKYKNLLESIGNTPLIKIPFPVKATVLAKLEYLNPGGSLKDRVALWMINDAEAHGLIKPGGTIVDASSGNMGIALAMIGAMKGYNVIITASEKVSQEKLKTLKAYGAKVVICPVTERIDDPQGYHSQAVKIAQETPNSFMPNQYFNYKNAVAHYHLLGPEIWQQTNGAVTHLFAAAGTGGHVSGAGKYLKEQNSAIKVIALDSVNSWRATHGHPKPYKVEGMGIDFESPVLDTKNIDEIIGVKDDDALNMLKIMAHEYGLLLGPSSGAITYAALEYARNLPENAVCVMVLGDSGRAYLSKDFYSIEDKPSIYKNIDKNIDTQKHFAEV